MRYLNLPNVIFNTADGRAITIKDFYEIPTDYILAFNLKLKAGDTLDEIANRKMVYGDNSEMSIYKIMEFNRVAIYEAGFDLDKLKNINIPVP
jgi:hypothetical protein